MPLACTRFSEQQQKVVVRKQDACGAMLYAANSVRDNLSLEARNRSIITIGTTFGRPHKDSDVRHQRGGKIITLSMPFLRFFDFDDAVDRQGDLISNSSQLIRNNLDLESGTPPSKVASSPVPGGKAPVPFAVSSIFAGALFFNLPKLPTY